MNGPGGRHYTQGMYDTIVQLLLADGNCIQTFANVLMCEDGSRFAEILSMPGLKNKKFVRLDCSHRNSRMLRFLVDYLRRLNYVSGETSMIWPDDFDDWQGLSAEARYWNLKEAEEHIQLCSQQHTNTITVSYHAALNSGKSSSNTNTDITFRRIHRILVHGQVQVCRDVFGEYLNENRDGNAEHTRYTSRFYLTHGFLEQAFDALAQNRFKLVGSSSHTPISMVQISPNTSFFQKPIISQNQSGDRQFLHYAQFVFQRTA